MTYSRTALGLSSLAAAAVLLAACGGSTPTTAPAASTSAAPSAGTSSAAPSASTSAAESASPSSSASTAGAAIKDPCEIIPAADMEKIVDADLGTAKRASDDESKTCTYPVTQSGKLQIASIIGLAPKSLKEELGDLQSKAKVTTIKIDGFEEAYELTASKSGAVIVGVAAKKGDLGYLVALVGTGSEKTYEGYGETIVKKLAAG